MGSTGLRTVRIGEDGELSFTLHDPRSGAEAVEADWQAALVAAAFAAGSGAAAEGSVPDVPEEEIASGLASAGLTAPAIGALRPGNGVALRVTARALEPEELLAALAREPDLLAEALPGLRSFAGVLLDVRDASGRPVLVDASARGGDFAAVWVRPDLAHLVPSSDG
jgi:hypothetical protein